MADAVTISSIFGLIFFILKLQKERLKCVTPKRSTYLLYLLKRFFIWNHSEAIFHIEPLSAVIINLSEGQKSAQVPSCCPRAYRASISSRCHSDTPPTPIHPSSRDMLGATDAAIVTVWVCPSRHAFKPQRGC